MNSACRIARMGRLPELLVSAVTALAVTLPPVCVAQEEKEQLTWYAVEIIVFERTNEIGRNAEAWPSEPGLPNLADAVELSPEGMSPQELTSGTPPESNAAGNEATAEVGSTPAPLPPAASPMTLPRPFQLMAEEEYRLADAWKSLEKSSAFRPLLHVGWIQPGYPAEEARLVHVRNTNAALGTVAARSPGSNEENVEGSVAESVGSRPADLAFQATLSPRITVARDPSKVALDGTLRVHRSRYLHVEADLLYYRPLDGDTSVPPGNDPGGSTMLDSPDTALIAQLLAEEDRAPRVFRLTESRRMRSRELHYLDHPLFGMLVEIVPLELPELPAQDDSPVQGDLPAEGTTTSEPTSEQSGSGG